MAGVERPGVFNPRICLHELIHECLSSRTLRPRIANPAGHEDFERFDDVVTRAVHQFPI